MNCERLVARLEVHCVEEANLVEADDMAEVPARNNIGVRYGRKRYMEHIVAKSRRQDSVCGISIGELDRLRGKLNAKSKARLQLGVQGTNSLGRIPDFRCQEVGKDRMQPRLTEVLDKGVRPMLELAVEASADH